MTRLVEKIISDLELDLTFYNRNTLKHKDGNIWDCFDKGFFDFIKDPKNWENFRLNGMTCGLETGLLQSDRKNILGKKLYEKNYTKDEEQDIINRFKELKNMMGDVNLSPLVCSEIGNPRNTYYSSTLLNFDDLYHLYSFWQISRFLDMDKKNILEIGAGYGNLAEKFIKHSNVKYFIIDLPETILIQHYYLKTNHPKIKVQKIKSSNDQIDTSNDVFLIPCFFLDSLKNSQFDLVINMRSFGEMNANIIKQYFNLINETLKDNGFLYTVNRYVTYRGSEIIRFKDYPFGDYWTTIISQPQWLQTHLHELLIKKNNKPDLPFQKILESLPNRTPPPGPIMANYSVDDWAKINKVK